MLWKFVAFGCVLTFALHATPQKKVWKLKDCEREEVQFKTRLLPILMNTMPEFATAWTNMKLTSTTTRLTNCQVDMPTVNGSAHGIEGMRTLYLDQVYYRNNRLHQLAIKLEYQLRKKHFVDPAGCQRHCWERVLGSVQYCRTVELCKRMQFPFEANRNRVLFRE